MRGDLGNRDRKMYLALRCLINCPLCRYHRNENAKRKPKDDKYKNKNRETIRTYQEVEVGSEFLFINTQQADDYLAAVKKAMDDLKS